MATTLRIATFNLENFDDPGPGVQPSLAARVALMRPQMERLRADILCLQEVNTQTVDGVRTFAALDELLAGTPYAGFGRAFTTVAAGTMALDVRNLVTLSRFPIASHRQIKHEITPRPAYRRVTAIPPDASAIDVTWERPILQAAITLPDGSTLQVLNLHLKSKLPTDIPGQHPSQFLWQSASGWAEGSFLSAIKRMGQAIETRMLIDQIFDLDPVARIAACGDFNADLDEVPLEAIRGDVENTGNPALVVSLDDPVRAEHSVLGALQPLSPRTAGDARSHPRVTVLAALLASHRRAQRDPARRVGRLRRRHDVSGVGSRAGGSGVPIAVIAAWRGSSG